MQSWKTHSNFEQSYGSISHQPSETNQSSSDCVRFEAALNSIFISSSDNFHMILRSTTRYSINELFFTEFAKGAANGAHTSCWINSKTATSQHMAAFLRSTTVSENRIAQRRPPFHCAIFAWPFPTGVSTHCGRREHISSVES